MLMVRLEPGGFKFAIEDSLTDSLTGNTPKEIERV